MLADVSDLTDCGLAPSDAALSEVAGEACCALCRAPHLERNASHATTLAWLDAYAPDEAARMREATIRENETGSPIGWKSIRTRIATDSELWPGYAIPQDLLDVVVSRLDPTLEAFVPDAFLAMICGRCAAGPAAEEKLGPYLARVYVERHANGNERAARVQPSWALVERFVAIVDDAARSVRFA